jgi:hypothetical protein
MAIAALCLAACVLLVARWVQSDSGIQYWDTRTGRTTPHFKGCVISYKQGRLQVDTRNAVEFGPDGRAAIVIMPQPEDPLVSLFGLQWTRVRGGVLVHLPYWFLVSILALLATVLSMPQLFRFRFSLRTLLIATVLIAVALGMIVVSS